MRNPNYPRLTVIAVLSGLLSLGFGQLPSGFLRGGDVSEIPEVEAAGGHYSYHHQQEDPFVIMRKAGWNFVRFRVWNDPKGGWCDKAHTLALAKRASEQRLKISLDFHYSDWWADPGKQTKPAAWRNLPFDKLEQAVYDYTKDVVSAMVAQGTPPCMVQIGNEIIGGMLWPDGRVSGNDPEKWKPLIKLLDAGIRAVHDARGSNRIQTMIHLDRGGDNKAAVWWFDNAIKGGLKFDLIGLSYYPNWHGGIDQMEKNVDDLADRYKKDVYIVETGYPWILDQRTKSMGHVIGDSRGLLPGYPASIEGQDQFLAKVIEVIRRIPHGRGKGLLYWAPTWISPGKAATTYDNVALFDYDGEALPSFDTLGGKQPVK